MMSICVFFKALSCGVMMLSLRSGERKIFCLSFILLLPAAVQVLPCTSARIQP